MRAIKYAFTLLQRSRINFFYKFKTKKNVIYFLKLIIFYGIDSRHHFTIRKAISKTFRKKKVTLLNEKKIRLRNDTNKI